MTAFSNVVSAINAEYTGHLTSLFGGDMNTWAVQDAKARFSELLAMCIQQGPQMVTYRGEEAAILVPLEEWRRLQASSRPTLKELLLSKEKCFTLDIPKRGLKKHRKQIDFLSE